METPQTRPQALSIEAVLPDFLSCYASEPLFPVTKANKPIHVPVLLSTRQAHRLGFDFLRLTVCGNLVIRAENRPGHAGSHPRPTTEGPVLNHAADANQETLPAGD